MESRRKQEFKKGVTADDGRRRRGETSVQLRKEKKEENLSKRRNLLPVNSTESPLENSGAIPQSQTPQIPQDKDRKFTINDIPSLMSGLTSEDSSTQVSSLRGFRKLLSAEKKPPVQECIDCGAVPLFVTYLQRNDNTELQFEAAWALTNIASTDLTRLVVDCGAVPFLSQLLASPNPEVREQCAWCLGNVAGDGAELRDIVLKNGALTHLLANIQQPANLSLLRNCTWTLSNFCRGKPQPPLSAVAPAIPVVAALLQSNCDEDTMIDAAWALSYLSDGDNHRIQAVVESGVVHILVAMLSSARVQSVIPALRTLGNIVSGDDHQTQMVVNANVLPSLTILLSHCKKNIRKESCWMLSNIAAGNIDQVNLLVNTPDLVPKLLTQLSAGAEWDVRKEAAWVVSNIATGGSRVHVKCMVEYGVIRPLCDLLDVAEVRVLLVAMEAIECILKNADNEEYTKLIDEAEGIEKLENLQEHEHLDVYEKAVHIIEEYFNGEDEVESENLAPAATAANQFSFGLSTQSTAVDFKGFNSNSAAIPQTAFSFGSL
eukprot:CAMPEP_0182416692 /NCGR_PEP_ID=MMETSP1167-20130531/1064_1 /TAXON_ID=2988 /ORGANISM="Mallomonas Sp, Strain CCMP3275" /LENGTH=545 /DNA_ID=CAMNT_0024589699 /DNA_START=38 /DNA_END=1675 /DNA_ORIENTATION=+